MNIKDLTKVMPLCEASDDPKSWSVSDALRAASVRATEKGITKCTVLLFDEEEGEVHFFHAGMSELEIIGLAGRHFVNAAQ